MTTNRDMTLREELAVLEGTLRQLSELRSHGPQGAAFAAAANEVAAILARHPAPDPIADAMRVRAEYRPTNGREHADGR